MGSLEASANDVIGCVLYYLDAIAIIKMLECGNQRLRAKVRQSCRILWLRTWPFMKFPFSLFNFPNLTSLTLDHHRQVGLYPLRLNGALPLPFTPVETLIKLDLCCTQSFSVLKLENGVPLLDTYFPHLKSLKLQLSSVSLMEDHMRAVPQGLEELELGSRFVTTDSSSIPVSALFNLPPSLSSLNLYSRPITTDEKTKDYSVVIWPSHLTKLTLRLLYPCILYHLPPHLEALALTLLSNETTQISSPIPTHIFPTSLTELSVFNMNRRPLLFTPTTFPPALKRCFLHFDYSSPKAAGWSQLPKSITECTTSNDFTNVGTFIDKLPNLTRFSGFFRFDTFPPFKIPELPRNLKELHLRRIPLALVPYLPESITDLRARIFPLSAASELPLIDDSSHPRDLPRGDMTRLPPFLCTLEVVNASTTEKFGKADFALIPQSVTDLTINLRHILDEETLSVLPHSLKTISIDVSPQTSEANLLLNPHLFDALPTALTSIQLNFEVMRTEWIGWMKNLHRFPALEQLQISFEEMDDNTEPISLDFLSSLPDTITDLQFSIHQTTMTPEQMAGLPKYLASLSIYSAISETSINSATDDCFANLPKTIVMLYLPRDLNGLTNNVLSLLPTSIASLSLPSNISTLLSTYYSREPEWDGFEPNHY